jgi:hypothetical protein
MEQVKVNQLTLYYEPSEEAAAELINEACQKSIALIGEHWGLNPPNDCRVYVMTGLLSYMFHSAPWAWRILMGITIPLWYPRLNRLWQIAGGWSQRYGRRSTVGVKPPRLIQSQQGSVGSQIFISFPPEERVKHNTCHELVHAFSEHLKLPTWLHEGLAMLTVDYFAGKPTIREDTLQVLARTAEQGSAETSITEKQYRELKSEDEVVYLYVRGYWIARYLDEKNHELLKSMLVRKSSPLVFESDLAQSMGMTRDEFWGKIDDLVLDWGKQAQ